MIIHGDTLETVKTLDANSIDCVITSPPYYQLRDYGWTGQWGLEKTYQEYLDKLVALMSELKRVLKPTGTMWINLGDTYGGSSMQGGLKSYEGDGKKDKSRMFKKDVSGQVSKSLMLIPHRFAIRCIDELGLILRNDVIWAKPNGMPESTTDRFSKKHEFFFFFVKQQKYYFDLDGVKIPTTTKDNSNRNRDITKLNNTPGRSRMAGPKVNNYDFKNPGDCADFWTVPTKPNSANHYATYNTQLIDKPIIAGCPEGGLILDPFCGTGTTLVRAMQLNRRAIGIDGKLEYVETARKNIEPYLIQEKMFT